MAHLRTPLSVLPFAILSAAIVLLSGAILSPGAPGEGTARADVTVIGDDDRDAFVGSGSLLLPPQIASDFRESAASCPGCAWRSVIQCEMTTAGSCRGPARLCGVDGFWLRVYVTGPDGFERDLGAACFGPSGPLSRETAELRLREEVLAVVPPLVVWRQPAAGVLPHLPVVFGVHQPDTPLQRRLEILGLPVDLVAHPRWAWDFGDRVVSTTSSGRRWPHQTIDHVYRRAGAARAFVTATWEATYTIAGLGPLRVADPVTQSADERLAVGEGRAVLVR